jgi:hypothetical protein
MRLTDHLRMGFAHPANQDGFSEGVAKQRGTGFGLRSAERHLARDSSRHFLGNRTFFTGKMPVPRLKTSISQLPSQG